jgi:hypothetical protein
MSKKHKVTFIDQVSSQPVAEIIEVESYKKYYIVDENLALKKRDGGGA